MAKSGSLIRGWVYGGSFALHAALAVTTLALPNEKRAENAAIELADLKKAKKEPPKPPPPPPPPPEDKPKPPPPPPKAQSQAKVAAEAPKAEAPPVDMGADGFADLGVSLGGGGDGVGIPIGGGPVAASAAGPAAAAKPKAVTKKAVESLAPSAADTCTDPPVRPKRKGEPFLKYPRKAQEAEIEGIVRVRVTVDEGGRVIATQVLTGLGYGLDEVAVDAVKKLAFEPATRCGRAIIGSVVLPIRFQLGT
jgi:periplasmic protein TonB